MSEHKKHLSCAWCDGEIGCGNKGYRRSIMEFIALWNV